MSMSNHSSFDHHHLPPTIAETPLVLVHKLACMSLVNCNLSFNNSDVRNFEVWWYEGGSVAYLASDQVFAPCLHTSHTPPPTHSSAHTLFHSHTPPPTHSSTHTFLHSHTPSLSPVSSSTAWSCCSLDGMVLKGLRRAMAACLQGLQANHQEMFPLTVLPECLLGWRFYFLFILRWSELR